jgi:hypothetical protein
MGGIPREWLSTGIKGKVPKLYIVILPIALKDAPIMTYGRKIVNLTLWDT